MTADIIALWITAAATSTAAVAAVISAIHMRQQSSKQDEQLRVVRLTVLLEAERELHKRKESLDQTSARMVGEDAKSRTSGAVLKELSTLLETRTENYLNAVDTFSLCLFKDPIAIIEWRREYGEFITDTIRDFDTHFGARTPYVNIIQLRDKWRDHT